MHIPRYLWILSMMIPCPHLVADEHVTAVVPLPSSVSTMEMKVVVPRSFVSHATLAPNVAAIRTPLWALPYAILEFDSSASARAFALRNPKAEYFRARARTTRSIPFNDPLGSFSSTNRGFQWHLQNAGENGGEPGIDLNVVPVWERHRGRGVVIGVLDDAVQVSHPDLAPNAIISLHGNWLDGSFLNPEGSSSDEHGTACAGLAAGRGDNGIGITGVAPEAKLAGLRMLGISFDDEVEGASLVHLSQSIDIKSCSWGPSDRSTAPDGPGSLARAAIKFAGRYGRNGKGTIFVWAAGNGRDNGDFANFDGYGNSIYTLTVGSVNDQGNPAAHSEVGANVMVAAPSSDGIQKITTTDLVGFAGNNSGLGATNFKDPDYRNNFGGSSAGAPQIAGVVALMLEANPTLGWRDVQEIVMSTAVRLPSEDGGWVNNSGGFSFHPAMGAGLVDAESAVAAALNWKALPPMEAWAVTGSELPRSIPDDDLDGILFPISFENSNVRVEHVTIEVHVAHGAKSDLSITLESPSGTRSELAEVHSPRGNDDNRDYLWQFSTCRHWGEALQGTWKLSFRDLKPAVSGTVEAFTVTAFGSRPGTTLSTYSQWAKSYFPGTAQDEAISGPSADPDKDGTRNLVEYAAGTLPLVGDTPFVGNDSYVRALNRVDVSLFVEFSSDLTTWVAGSDAPSGENSEGRELRRFTPPAGVENGHFRLKASLRD